MLVIENPSSMAALINEGMADEYIVGLRYNRIRLLIPLATTVAEPT